MKKKQDIFHKTSQCPPSQYELVGFVLPSIFSCLFYVSLLHNPNQWVPSSTDKVETWLVTESTLE